MNKDHLTRDKIIFGSYNPSAYFGGCRRFTCDRDVVVQLYNEQFIDPDESQNYSPTAKEFIKWTTGLSNVSFECYAISPERGDYRVTIEGIDIEILDNDYDTISELVTRFGSADEFTFDHNGDTYFLHAWWD